MHKIAVITAHSDDPIIGMGGTIKKLSSMGYKVTVISVCGDRIDGFEEAINFLSAEPIYLDFSYGNIHENELREHLREFFRSYSWDVVFTHWDHEILYDHEIVSKAVIKIAKQLEKKVFMFEIPASSIDFKFDVAINIDDFYEFKKKSIELMKKAFDCHIFNNEIYPSILFTAGFRGIQVGCRFAEVFNYYSSRYPLAPYKMKKFALRDLIER